MSSMENQVIALAGMYQAAYLVRSIAHEGMPDQASFKRSIDSLLVTDSEDSIGVYGGVEGIELGLDVLHTLFSRQTKARDLEISHYVLGIAHLYKKLKAQPQLVQKIADGIDAAKIKAANFGSTHDNVLAHLADVYANTVSTLTPRIVVSGEQGYLSVPANADKVRALLLALMRSCFLWDQNGGRRWHLVFKRSKIQQSAQKLLNEVCMAHSELLE